MLAGTVDGALALRLVGQAVVVLVASMDVARAVGSVVLKAIRRGKMKAVMSDGVLASQMVEQRAWSMAGGRAAQWGILSAASKVAQ